MGGAQVTLWNFVVMIAAVFGVLHFLPQAGSEGNFYGFLAMFMLLFVTTGVGNGSTFRMIPVIFRTQHERLSAGKSKEEQEQARKNAGKEVAAVLGLQLGDGRLRRLLYPQILWHFDGADWRPANGPVRFVGFYVSCIVLTWWWYARKGAEMPC